MATQYPTTMGRGSLQRKSSNMARIQSMGRADKQVKADKPKVRVTKTAVAKEKGKDEFKPVTKRQRSLKYQRKLYNPLQRTKRQEADV